MNPILSVYLDAVRVIAALAVVLCHFGSQRVSGGLLWQATPYGAEAVDVFFVLSGFVIAATAQQRETRAGAFAVARLTRIYSVAVPAFLLTWGLDAAGVRWMPQAYASFPAVMAAHVVNGGPIWQQILQQVVAGLGFVNESWLGQVPIGSNVPWWSLGCEVPYYLAFGLAWFGRGVSRWAVAPALLLLGPNVAMLAPAWLAGLVVWRAHAVVLSRSAAWALSLGPVLAWGGYEVAVWRWGRPFLHSALVRPEAGQDLLIALLFALHLRGMCALTHGWAMGGWAMGGARVGVFASRAIRFAAARSFSLYLYHLPLLMFLRAAMLRFCPGVSPVWMLPVMLVAVLVLAQVTERQRFRLQPGRVRIA